eukprot:scaffold5039_cov50-Phaeocystis_antarctica.AAC.1
MSSAPASVIAPPSHSSRRLAHAGSAAASPAAPASPTWPEMLSTLSLLGASRACNRRCQGCNPMYGGGLLGGWRASPMAAAHAKAQASPACEPARCSRLGRERAGGECTQDSRLDGGTGCRPARCSRRRPTLTLTLTLALTRPARWSRRRSPLARIARQKPAVAPSCNGLAQRST